MAADANSFVQQYRFAASDYVQDTIKSQAFSRVLIGGIAAGIMAPSWSCTTKIFYIQSLLPAHF